VSFASPPLVIVAQCVATAPINRQVADPVPQRGIEPRSPPPVDQAGSRWQLPIQGWCAGTSFQAYAPLARFTP